MQPRSVRSLWVPAAIGAAVAISTASLLALAGPLDPPVGPVTSTNKTLSDVEPRIAISAANTPGDADSIFKISQPGSYYLTGNITGVVGKHGIEIVSSGVTLDLNGFDLSGVAGSIRGVTATASVSNVTVVNGSVRSWASSGVDLELAINSRVADLRVAFNAGYGVRVSDNCSISNCTLLSNSVGIATARNPTIACCTVWDSGNDGISTTNGGTISDCTSYDNVGDGFDLGPNSLITGCSANANSNSGIKANQNSTVTACMANGNGGHGISSTGSTITNCTAYLNSTGIHAYEGSVTNCVTKKNQMGIVALGSTIDGCTSRENTFDGIQCFSSCIIRGNTCTNNGFGDGAGIHLIGSGTRIEGNNCTGADRGIDVDSAGNVIIKNTCSGNGIDWDIVADNVFGPILDRRAPESAAVIGFSAPDSTGSTHPNANFSY